MADTEEISPAVDAWFSADHGLTEFGEWLLFSGPTQRPIPDLSVEESFSLGAPLSLPPSRSTKHGITSHHPKAAPRHFPQPGGSQCAPF